MIEIILYGVDSLIIMLITETHIANLHTCHHKLFIFACIVITWSSSKNWSETVILDSQIANQKFLYL
ncbi:MAG: hypothetical protein JJU02_15945 [Cryomorphaceae bacterium]|nr:hypothetical protein [Cryomorphaceae bacterium]